MLQDINKIIEEKNILIEQKNKQLEIEENNNIRKELIKALKINNKLRKIYN